MRQVVNKTRGNDGSYNFHGGATCSNKALDTVRCCEKYMDE